MKLTIKETEYNLRLLCGKFNELKDKLRSENLMDTLMEGISSGNAEMLATVLSVVAIEPKLDKRQALAAMDEYLEDGEHTVMSFGLELLEVLDHSGFLPKRGMAKAIRDQMGNGLEQVDKMLGDANLMSQMMESVQIPKEFVGYKA